MKTIQITFALFLLSLVLAPAADAQRALHARKIPQATCKEFPSSIFQPCICDFKVPKTIKYRPSLNECGGDAAAILGGQFGNSYSVGLRDNQNRDRWPASGYQGCSAAEVEAGLNKCSAFKCQKVIRRKDSRGRNEQVCCFGERGSSPIMAAASRMTIKLRDIPSATNDPLVRVCLQDFEPTVKLN